MMKKSKSVFNFKPFSTKQLKVLKWWIDPRTKDKDGVIADGAIRSGKTLVMSLSLRYMGNGNIQQSKLWDVW